MPGVPAVTRISLDSLPKVAEGKVRDLFEIDHQTLLFVASDRISAYDVVMNNVGGISCSEYIHGTDEMRVKGIPTKGPLLTLLSTHWFSVLSAKIPDLKTHFVTLDLPRNVPASAVDTLKHRSMQVRKLKIFPLEIIVRGYITGSAWKEYQKSSTVHGIKIEPGLKESQAFPQGAIYTPSTKAPAGESDENIHPSQALEIVGAKYASRIEDLALKLYITARDHAAERGIIIADTKFEFGLDEDTDEIVLVDEVLTPDSSRFWPAATYEVGREQQSYDKQGLRDWLTKEGLKGKKDVEMPQEVVDATATKYQEAFEKLTGQAWSAALSSN